LRPAGGELGDGAELDSPAGISGLAGVRPPADSEHCGHGGMGAQPPPGGEKEALRLYSQSELKKIFPDVHGNTLLSWAKEGLIEWEREIQDGRGIHRLYSVDNIYRLEVVKELLAMGVLPRIIKSEYKLLFSSKWRETKGYLILERCNPGPTVVVDLGRVKFLIDQKIKNTD
jgi:hypothetical protein